MRILVDGYSLLHAWPDLAPGRARHSATARAELVTALTRYRDAVSTPITVFFDGAGAPAGTSAPHSSPEMEILFSRDGKTAEALHARFLPLEDLRESISLIRVLHDAVTLSGLADMGAHLPMLSPSPSDRLAEIKEQADALLAYERGL